MQPLVILLILGTAITHATWNGIAKASKNILAVIWWSTVLATVGYGTWLFFGLGFFLSPNSLIPFIVSAICETGYFVTLVKGYSKGDLSLVYPISRGSAPIFAALFSILVLEESLPLFGYVGVALMVIGVFVASQPVEKSKFKFEFSTIMSQSAIGWALASGVFIAIYSVTDKLAILATNPLIYNWWVFLGNAILWAPFVWRRSSRKGNFDELRNNWWSIIAVGTLSVGSYALALIALALTNASYVVAGRGLSVIFGASIGSLVLKERFGVSRIIGASLMVVGLSLIAFS